MGKANGSQLCTLYFRGLKNAQLYAISETNEVKESGVDLSHQHLSLPHLASLTFSLSSQVILQSESYRVEG